MPSNGSRTEISVQIKDWWNHLPLLAVCFFWVSSILCILSYFTWFPLLPWTLSYINFAENHWYWTLLTYPFQPSGILATSVSIYLYTTTAGESERHLGTSRYIIFIFYYIISIGLLYLGLIYLLKFISQTLFDHFCLFPFFGIWPIIMIELVLKYNTDPESYIKFLCFPCPIQNKYFPWIYFSLVSVLLLARFWESLLGILVGYIRK